MGLTAIAILGAFGIAAAQSGHIGEKSVPYTPLDRAKIFNDVNNLLMAANAKNTPLHSSNQDPVGTVLQGSIEKTPKDSDKPMAAITTPQASKETVGGEKDVPKNSAEIINHTGLAPPFNFNIGFTVSPGPNVEQAPYLVWNDEYVGLLIQQIAQFKESSGLSFVVMPTYYPPVPGTDLNKAKEWLDKIYTAGGRLIVGIPNYDDRRTPSFDVNYWNGSGRPKDSFKIFVEAFKDHPAIQGWNIFNEYNYLAQDHPEWFGAKNTDEAIKNILEATQYTAAKIKEIDKKHEVYTIWSGLPTKEQVESVPATDGWGLNYYEIPKIINGEFFKEAVAALGNKSFFIHETGVDSWDSDKVEENEKLQADEAKAIFEAAVKYAPRETIVT